MQISVTLKIVHLKCFHLIIMTIHIDMLFWLFQILLFLNSCKFVIVGITLLLTPIVLIGFCADLLSRHLGFVPRTFPTGLSDPITWYCSHFIDGKALPFELQQCIYVLCVHSRTTVDILSKYPIVTYKINQTKPVTVFI